jgi:hypothetical protein
MPHVCRRKVARLAPDVLRRLAKGFAAEKQEARSRAGATIKNGSKTVWWTFMFYWFTIYICLFTIYILLFFLMFYLFGEPSMNIGEAFVLLSGGSGTDLHIRDQRGI